jgi:hypothetical protein
MNSQLSLLSNESNLKIKNQEDINSQEKSRQTLSMTLLLKSKFNQKNKTFFHYSSIETTITPSIDEITRKDFYGNVITKKNKDKYKVTFIDKVDENKKLVEVIPVESYKEINYEIYKGKYFTDKENICCNENCTIL